MKLPGAGDGVVFHKGFSMPLYAVHCLDGADALETRLARHAEHRAYLAAAKVKLIVAGPLVSPNGEKMIGSLFIVEADTMEAVADFNGSDPFTLNKVWEKVQINRFDKKTDNR
jgi:uncharacterized protein